MTKPKPGDVGAAEEAADWGVSGQEYAAASSVVEEALQSAQHLLSDTETALLREDLLLHLFGSPEGRRALRAMMETPDCKSPEPVDAMGVVSDDARFEWTMAIRDGRVFHSLSVTRGSELIASGRLDLMPDHGYVADIWVPPRMRGVGLGDRVLSSLLERAKLRGTRELRLDPIPYERSGIGARVAAPAGARERLQRWYERRGFVPDTETEAERTLRL